MDDGLEVYFCDLCNTSVPEGDLGTGKARRANGKVVGACCLAELGLGAKAGAGAQAKGGAAGQGALLGVGVVVLIGIAGATAFLDWRLGEEARRVDARFDASKSAVLSLDRKMTTLEERVTDRAAAADVRALGTRLEEELARARSDRSAFGDQLGTRIAGVQQRQEQITSAIDALRSVTEKQQGSLLGVERELARVSGDVAAIRAAPRPRIDDREAASAVPPSVPAARDGAGGAADASVPAEIAHLVASLDDSDPGARFEAVEGLIASGHVAARDALRRMVKDPDPFVRRISVEGLASFPHADSVDTLLDALADEEGIVRHAAHLALSRLTAQNIPFDATADADARLAAQRRWRDWWSENRAGFTF